MLPSRFAHPSPGKSIRDAEQWSLIGEGYRSENEAAVAGAAFHDALLIAFAKMRVGVDFGSRTPKGGITAYGQEVLSNQTGQRALNNVHGLMVYTSDPKPVFFEQKASFVIGRAIQSFDKLYFSTLKPVLSDRDRLALTLYHASYFQPTADTRFLVLVMAIEALIEPGPKSAAAIEYVDRFIDDINGSSLAPPRKTPWSEVCGFYAMSLSTEQDNASRAKDWATNPIRTNPRHDSFVMFMDFEATLFTAISPLQHSTKSRGWSLFSMNLSQTS